MDILGFWQTAFEWLRTLPLVVQILMLAETTLLGILATMMWRQRRESLRLHHPDGGQLVYAVYRAKDRTFDAYWYDEMSFNDDDTPMRHHTPGKTKAVAHL